MTPALPLLLPCLVSLCQQPSAHEAAEREALQLFCTETQRSGAPDLVARVELARAEAELVLLPLGDVWRAGLRTLRGDSPRRPTAAVTVLHLWSVSCAPCVRELPRLERVISELRPYTEVLAISEDLTEPLSSLNRRCGPDRTTLPGGQAPAGLPALLQEPLLVKDDSLRRRLGVTAQPLTLVLDREFVIRQAFIGSLEHRFGALLEAVSALDGNTRVDIAAPHRLPARARPPYGAPALTPAEHERLVRTAEEALLHFRVRGLQRGGPDLVWIAGAQGEPAPPPKQLGPHRTLDTRQLHGALLGIGRRLMEEPLLLLLDHDHVVRRAFVGPLQLRMGEVVEAVTRLRSLRAPGT